MVQAQMEVAVGAWPCGDLEKAWPLQLGLLPQKRAVAAVAAFSMHPRCVWIAQRSTQAAAGVIR